MYPMTLWERIAVMLLMRQHAAGIVLPEDPFDPSPWFTGEPEQLRR